MSYKNKVLHITPHLGGGVGSVVLNWLKNDNDFKYSVATLDFANEKAKSELYKCKIPLYSNVDYAKLTELIKDADIVLMHFWNHPLLYDFILRTKFPACRLVVYSHISGLYAPNLITKKILDFADEFVYTTSISNKIAPKKVILSTGGISRIENLKRDKQPVFTAGYIGTVDYAKMHPEFIPTLSKIKDINFLIVGGDSEKEIQKNAPENFTFTGKVADIRPYLAKMDIFSYLLNPNHFGTAEQVLQEALAAGVVPVVLDNECEKTLVKHNETGLVAKNLNEYTEFIELLKNDENLRKKLSENGKKYAREHFSIENFIKSWYEVFKKILESEKKLRTWVIDEKKLSSYDVFLESIGEYRKYFEFESEEEKKKLKSLLDNPNWKSKSKGTPKQYFEFLKGESLKRITDLYE